VARGPCPLHPWARESPEETDGLPLEGRTGQTSKHTARHSAPPKSTAEFQGFPHCHRLTALHPSPPQPPQLEPNYRRRRQVYRGRSTCLVDVVAGGDEHPLNVLLVGPDPLERADLGRGGGSHTTPSFARDSISSATFNPFLLDITDVIIKFGSTSSANFEPLSLAGEGGHEVGDRSGTGMLGLRGSRRRQTGHTWIARPTSSPSLSGSAEVADVTDEICHR
jgi:hypothetical protein